MVNIVIKAMDQKRIVEVLGDMTRRLETVQSDINNIKLDLARSERLTKLENKMAAMEVKVWVLFGVLVLVASAFIGFYFNTNG